MLASSGFGLSNLDIAIRVDGSVTLLVRNPSQFRQEENK
jgi:hypothetical protein